MWVANKLERPCASDNACADMKGDKVLDTAETETEAIPSKEKPEWRQRKEQIYEAKATILDGQPIREKSRSVKSVPEIDGPAIYAEYLKKIVKDKSPTARKYEQALIYGLEVLFKKPGSIDDAFERKRAEDARETALAGIEKKFIAKYGKQLQTYKYTYTGSILFSDYDFKTGEVILVLCDNAKDVFTSPEMATNKYFHGATYDFDCRQNRIFSQKFPPSSLVDAVGDLDIGLPLAGSKSITELEVVMSHTELRIKMPADKAEKLKKDGTLPQIANYSYGSAGGRTGQISIFYANIELAFDAVKARMQNLGGWGNDFPHEIIVLLKPTKVCLEDILTTDKYFCGVAKSEPHNIF